MATRRVGKPDSKTRTALIEAAERLMLEEGYAAVTSRRVGAEAGENAALVHYYFKSMDDLFLAVIAHLAENTLKLESDALTSPQPLRALWQFLVEPKDFPLWAELFALAHHRKAIRVEIVNYYTRARAMQIGALSALMDRYGLDSEEYPPAALALLMSSISRAILMESSLGIFEGHAEIREITERLLQQIEAGEKQRDRVVAAPRGRR